MVLIVLGVRFLRFPENPRYLKFCQFFLSSIGNNILYNRVQFEFLDWVVAFRHFELYCHIMTLGSYSEEGTTSKFRLITVSVIGIVLIIMSISIDFVAQSNLSYSGYSLYNHYWSESNADGTNNPSVIKRIYQVNSTWRAGVSKNASAGETLCAYLRANPSEPELIFYNRMPKAGSSTMEALYNKLSKKYKFGRWQAHKEFWGEMDHNIDDFEKRVANLNQLPHYIIDGHWSQRLFNTSLFKRNAEYIQLIRECRGWVTSKVDYGLFDSTEARKAKSKNKYDEFIKSKLKINHTDIDKCLTDKTCLLHANIIPSPDSAYRYVCDKNCSSKYGFDNGVTSVPTLNNPDTFIVVGVLSQLEKYLYVLECAYPNILRGIRDMYLNQHIHSKISSKIHNTDALQSLVNETCGDSTKYNNLYAETEQILLNQFDYLMANKNKCCRKSRYID